MNMATWIKCVLGVVVLLATACESNQTMGDEGAESDNAARAVQPSMDSREQEQGGATAPTFARNTPPPATTPEPESAKIAAEPIADLGVVDQGVTSENETETASEQASKKPTVAGSLDKEIIRRVVRRHRSEVRYCYEKELVKNPDLAGMVKVKFVISGTGSVASAEITSTTMNNAEVEQCMLKSIRRWTFPKPTGGGIVNVNYPFKFSSN